MNFIPNLNHSEFSDIISHVCTIKYIYSRNISNREKYAEDKGMGESPSFIFHFKFSWAFFVSLTIFFKPIKNRQLVGTHCFLTNFAYSLLNIIFLYIITNMHNWFYMHFCSCHPHPLWLCGCPITHYHGCILVVENKQTYSFI